MSDRLPRFALQRRSMASNPSTPVETLLALARQDLTDEKTVMAVALNKRMPWLALAFLVRELDPGLRAMVGRNIDSVKAVSIVMSNDPVARAITETGDMPGPYNHEEALPALMSLLAHSNAHQVRELVARNERTPPEALTVLGDDQFIGVLIEVAKHPNTTPATLLKLAHVPHTGLLEGTMTGHSKPAGAFPFQQLGAAVAWHPNTPVGALRTLAADGHTGAVAGNPNAPASLLAVIARKALDAPAVDRGDPVDFMRGEEIKGVLYGVGFNRNTPTEILEQLVAEGFEFFEAVAGNASAPAELLAQIADNPWASMDAKQNVARNPNTARETLERLAGDTWTSVRQAATNRLQGL